MAMFVLIIFSLFEKLEMRTPIQSQLQGNCKALLSVLVGYSAFNSRTNSTLCTGAKIFDETTIGNNAQIGGSRDVYHGSVNRSKNFTTYGDHAQVEGNHNVTRTFLTIASFQSISCFSFQKHMFKACRLCQHKTYGQVW